MSIFIDDNDITLVAGGYEYSMWTDISVTASVNEATRTFSATLAEISISGNFSPIWLPNGTAVQVVVAGVVQCDGYSNSYEPSFDADSHSVSIKGRGKSQDVIDCSCVIENGRLEDMTILEMAQAMAGTVNVGVTSEAEGAEKVIKKFQVNQGETILSAIERLCKRAPGGGLSIMGASDGDIELIDFKDPPWMSNPLIQGLQPFLSASASISDQEKKSDTEVKTQLAGHEDRYQAEAASLTFTYKDRTVARYRPQVVILDSAGDAEDAQARAEMYVRRQNAQDITASVTIQGHTLNGEEIKVGRLIYVKSDFLKLDGIMAIEGVVWGRSSAGATTQLSLVPPAALGNDDDDTGGADSGASDEAYSPGQPQSGGSGGSSTATDNASESAVSDARSGNTATPAADPPSANISKKPTLQI